MSTADTGNREAMLAAIRRFSGTTAAQARSFSPPPPRHAVRTISPQEISEESLRHLADELKRLSGAMRQIASLEDLPSAVLQLAREFHYKRVAVNDDSLLNEAALPERLQPFQDFRPLLTAKDAIPTEQLHSRLAQCQLGITGCEAVLLDTATVVMDHRGWGGRAISLLPECHLVVARRSQLFATLDDWMDASQNQPAKLPACITLITGPSRTADIEKVLVTGVHGPLRLVLFLVD